MRDSMKERPCRRSSPVPLEVGCEILGERCGPGGVGSNRGCEGHPGLQKVRGSAYYDNCMRRKLC